MITEKNTTEITHLVVNGCSWTYCQGLSKPTEDGWPALLAKKLNVPVVNLAVKGSGNESIHRRTYEYINENLPTGSKPLVIILWSQIWRQEAWFKEYYSLGQLNDYGILIFPDAKKPATAYEAALVENWSTENFLRKLMLHQSSLSNLFKANNIPHLFANYASFGLEENVLDNIKNRFPAMYDAFSTYENHAGEAYKITDPYPKTACGHDGLEAQIVLAAHLNSYLTNIYGKFNVVSKDYLTLKDFRLSKLDFRDNLTVWR